MELSLKSALDSDLPTLAELLNRSFSGYLVTIKFSPAALAQMFRQDGIDLSASRVILQAGQVVGCALLARRGRSCRVAAMGLTPESRGQGIGGWLMAQLIAEAQNRQEQTMVLEVIEQNEPGLRLYKRLGFRRLRRLVGYRLAQAEGVASDDLSELDLSDVARKLTCYASPDLPWQLSGETLAQSGWPNQGYCLGPAYAAISDPTQPQLILKALVVPPEARRKGAATRLLQALMAYYPQKSWYVPILWPEEVAVGLFEPLGFSRESLTQLQMSLDLTA
jgi:ribosomal protein S18 acetylase RimI-like enzyme